MGLLVLKRPCSCGSGREARGCCGLFSHVGQPDAARAYMARQARQAREFIGPFSPAALTTLRAEAATLPARCALFTDSLLIAREPVSSELRKIARALERSQSGPLGSRRVLAALEEADSPMARVAVAKAVISLREGGLIDEHLAAAALLELAGAVSPIAEAALLAAGRSIAGLDLMPAGSVAEATIEQARPAPRVGMARSVAAPGSGTRSVAPARARHQLPTSI